MCAVQPTTTEHESTWGGNVCAPLSLSFTRTEPARAIDALKAARTAKIEGHLDNARLLFDLADSGLPRISDRIALEQAELAIVRDRPERAIGLYEYAMSSSSSEVRVRAASGRVRALIESDHPDAKDALHRLLWLYPEMPTADELNLAMAQSLERKGKTREAIRMLRRLEIRTPGSDVGQKAHRLLHEFANKGISVPPRTLDQIVLRATRLLRTGPLSMAKAEVKALLSDIGRFSPDQRGQINWLAGRLAQYEGRWSAAKGYLVAAQQTPPENTRAARRLEQRAQDMADAAEAREQKRAKARVRRLVGRKSMRAVSARRLKEIIHIGSRAGLKEEVTAALDALTRQRKVPPGVLFDAAIIATGTADDAKIVAALRPVSARQDRRGLAATYHMARGNERLGNTTVARHLYQQVIDRSEAFGIRYYSMWSELGLSRLDGVPREPSAQEAQMPIPHAPTPSLDALAAKLAPVARAHPDIYPWFGRARDLLLLGDTDAATAELFDAYVAWRRASGRPITRAGLESVAKGKDLNREPMGPDLKEARLELTEAQRKIVASVATELGDHGTAAGFGGSAWVRARPRAYEWLAIPAANRYGLDPNLLLAVMRVESVYQKRIVSYAGAIGLTQIMPRTGQLIAHAVGHRGFTPADLLDPKTNLEFSAWYLTSLLRRFDGHLPLAIAAYNGGPHNVRRWMQDHATSIPLDALLERIPFEQTHRYVRRVLVHYEAYRKQRGLPMQPLSTYLPEQSTDPLSF